MSVAWRITTEGRKGEKVIDMFEESEYKRKKYIK